MNLQKLIPAQSLILHKVLPEILTVKYRVVIPASSLTKEECQSPEVSERITLLVDARTKYLMTEGVISDKHCWITNVEINLIKSV